MFGRSIPYRMGALQPLALMAYADRLPAGILPAQARGALTKVMHRMFDGRENFNSSGFTTIGFAGRQPNVADWYTNNGSLYMTSLALLPWASPPATPSGPTPHSHHLRARVERSSLPQGPPLAVSGSPPPDN